MKDQNLEEMFREVRKAREVERLKKLREFRLKSSNANAASVSMCLPTKSVAVSSSTSTSNNFLRPMKSAAVSNTQCVSTLPAAPSSSNNLRPRRSLGKKRKSILKRKVEVKAASRKPASRKPPKAEVRLTKTTRLRLLKSDPLLQYAHQDISSADLFNLPRPTIGLSKSYCASQAPASKGVDVVDRKDKDLSPGKSSKIPHLPAKKASFMSPLKNETSNTSSKFQSPSRIPVRKTPYQSSTLLTPNPSPLREKLVEWLERYEQPLDNFKHLRCFGTLGPVVKRPQTPFRKAALSSSTLQAIPESTETSPQKETAQDVSDDDKELNTTFTLEDEDKENIFCAEEAGTSESTTPVSYDKDLKELDKSYGVLFELHKLIQMGYPLEQCKAWLRAIRRRFPQCGDEAIYWECLASLDEFEGDIQSAVACYEQAINRGAEGSVQKSLDGLLQKMAAMNIKLDTSASPKKASKQYEKSLLDTSNIIKSSSIRFAVQEMQNSSVKKNNCSNEATSDASFIATPVRRSTRLNSTPRISTPGVTCIRSLEFLDTSVKKSLVFHGNSALEPRD